MSSAERVQLLEREFVLPVYRRFPVVLTRGEGVYLFDETGRRYLDLISGVGVASLGHAHPGLAGALAEQARTLLHCSNLFYHPLQGELAQRLAGLSGLSRAFFCNSGAEAVETCLKFARRYWYSQGATERTGIVALEHAFHGRTLGAISATWDEHYRKPFEPLIPGVTFVPPNDQDALRAAVTDRTAAVIVEPIQGEGGVRPLTPAYAAAINDVSAHTGALIIADEVQSGLGRTGFPFCFSTIGLRPHLIAIGKALGAGVPVAAALFSHEVAAAAEAGDHGSTYGGNLLACRAALYFLDELTGSGLLSQIGRVGAHFGQGLRALAEAHPGLVADVRGAGLIWGLEVRTDATPLVNAALHQGLLINRTAKTVLRFLPPLVITESEIDAALEGLSTVLDEAEAEVAV